MYVGDRIGRADNDADGAFDCDDDGCAGSPDCVNPSTDTDTGKTCEGAVIGVQVGECASDFTLLDQDGVSHSLYDYSGRVILLDFSGFT